MRRSRIVLASLLGLALMFGPSLGRAAETPHEIRIVNDRQFDAAHGVRSGRGTPANPYVISGWTLNTISISDTTKAFKLVGNTIHGTLTLNWVGRHVEAHDNKAGDLRVNENVKRTGAPTSGMIMHNQFGVVGQLRHFDGMFMHNVVGTPQSDLALFGNGEAVNFDGFNGARLSHNVIYGSVRATLHGHHHSSGYATQSHMHSGHHDMMVDHTRRYHEVFIEHNKIFSYGYAALTYTDSGHEINDRTATSETNPKLVGPHVHYTRVHIVGNVLRGSGIAIQEFNAADQYHRVYAPGVVDIVRNNIELSRPAFYPLQSVSGIWVFGARALSMRITQNTIRGPERLVENESAHRLESSRAIDVYGFDRARLIIGDNRLIRFGVGVFASQLSKTVNWKVGRLWTEDVDQAMDYDSGSVANKPSR